MDEDQSWREFCDALGLPPLQHELLQKLERIRAQGSLRVDHPFGASLDRAEITRRARKLCDKHGIKYPPAFKGDDVISGVSLTSIIIDEPLPKRVRS